MPRFGHSNVEYVLLFSRGRSSGLSCCAAKIDKTGDVFVVADLEKRLHMGVIGIPLGQPLCGSYS